ncbi:MAG: hypothetical protein U1E10_16045 [Bdellovibrionales bacterium]|nr:hypothetical protein [Bdellovibrionales bacterium]
MGNQKPTSSGRVQASRIAPAKISPITHKGVRYEAPWSARGAVVAFDEKTGKEVWRLVLANYFIDENLETDVQETYLAKMELSKDGKELLVEDERRVPYVVDLEKRSFQILKWAVKTKIVEFKPGPKGWSYWVELTVTNSLNRELLLDGISVASDGSIDNNLFRVLVDGQAVQYSGMLKKRAPPDPGDFVKLAPGSQYKKVIELSKEYPVPPGRHIVEVGFEHRNHFSPDGFMMWTPLFDKQEFVGEGFKFSEKLPAFDEVISSSADRNAPAAVEPVRVKGFRYEAPASQQGVLVAYFDKNETNEAKKKVAWTLPLVNYWIDKKLETDVQEVYLTKLTLSKDARMLTATDERGMEYLVDLEKRSFRIAHWPVKVKIIERKPTSKNWKYKVNLTIFNSLARELKFDGVSVAANGNVANNLFRVAVDGKEVPYQGDLMSRAKPNEKDFIRLSPGATYSVDVDLTELYPIPAGRHKVEVGFEHTNHFSPDGFVMRSSAPASEVFE